MKKLSKGQVNNILWEAYDCLKEIENTALSRDLLAAMYLLKFVTDRSKDDDFKIIKVEYESSFDYIYSKKDSRNIQELIENTFTRLESNNKPRLGSVFQSLDWEFKHSSISLDKKSQAMVNMIESLNKLKLFKDNLENIYIPANVFSQFIQDTELIFPRKGDNSYVPKDLSRLVVNLLSPEKGESIYDPSCGLGDLLSQAYRKSGDCKTNIFGQVENENLFRLCKINMILNNIENENIRLGESIAKPLHLEGEKLKKFDLVLSKPVNQKGKWTEEFNFKKKKDFEMKSSIDPYNRFELGLPPGNETSFLYILHMLNSLNDQGRMAIITYPGVLFREGAEGSIRKNIIKNNLLEGIIMLPEKMLIKTSLSSVILLFKKNRKDENILMIDLNQDKYIVKENITNKIKAEITDKVVDAYEKFKEYKGFSKIVNRKEIRENDYNLYIPKYILKVQDEEEQSIKEIKANISRIKSKIETVEYEIESLINRDI